MGRGKRGMAGRLRWGDGEGGCGCFLRRRANREGVEILDLRDIAIIFGETQSRYEDRQDFEEGRNNGG